ncbi:MAG TPA: STAS domain-containing protein [Calditrichia bacterium]|nr:STAS domain-containing protein [Calditrichia bacterium]
MIEQEGIKIETHVIEQKANTLMVGISGYVDQANCHLLQKTINTCLDDEYFNLVFNFQGLVYMSSAGWGVLIGEIKRFRESGGDIKLANMGPEIYEIYQMLEFYHIISEYPSVEEALKSFGVDDPAVASSPKAEPEPAPEKSESDKKNAKNKNVKAKSGKKAGEPEAEDKSPEPEEPEQPEAEEAETPAEEEPEEKAPEKPSVQVPRPEVNGEPVIEEALDINLDEILADEGISTSGLQADRSDYVEFDVDRYSREVNIKVMPIPDKIRAIIGNNPELSVWKIREVLRSDEYGNVKIGYFKLRSLLRSMELDSKEKRYRFYRSA